MRVHIVKDEALTTQDCNLLARNLLNYEAHISNIIQVHFMCLSMSICAHSVHTLLLLIDIQTLRLL